MLTYSEIIRGARPWQGVLDTSGMVDDMVSAGHQLADAAKAGNWPAVMKVLDRECRLAGHQPVAAGRHGVVHRPAPGRMAWRAHRGRRTAARPGRAAVPSGLQGAHRVRRSSRASPKPCTSGHAAAAALCADADTTSGTRRTTR